MKAVSILYLLLIPICNVSGQHHLDSLWTIWSDNNYPDTTRLIALQKFITDGYMYNLPDSAFYFAGLQYEFAKSKGLKKEMALALNTRGSSLQLRGDYPQAIEYYRQSLALREEIHDSIGIAGSLGNIGLSYINTGSYPIALGYIERSLKIKEEKGDMKGIANSMNNLGLIYKEVGNYPKALECYNRTMQIFIETGNKRGIAGTLTNIGIIHNLQGLYDDALKSYDQSLEAFEEIGDKYGISASLNNIGTIYHKQADYRNALEYFERGLKVNESLGNKNGIASSLNNVGITHLSMQSNNQAIEWCEKGLSTAQSANALDAQYEACDCLYSAWKNLGNSNRALVFHEKMISLKDSLQRDQAAEKLQKMEFAKSMLEDSIANAEERRLLEESHTAEVRRKNQTRNIAFGIIGFVIVLALGIYSRLRHVRKSREIIESERNRSDNLLLNILPAEIAAELKEHGRTEARRFEKVSILFSDFKGFTEISAGLTADQLVEEINVCFEEFDRIMERCGIEKIKTIGDAYMAAGGLPRQTENSTRNTVLAAIEMQSFIISRKLKNDSIGKPAFEMRVGIHTGPVVAGIVGVRKFQYDIWGDTVNTASRMENMGEPGKVNISQSTYDLLKDETDLEFEYRGKLNAKGKGEIDMYFVQTKSTQ